MKQAVEEAAKEFAKSVIDSFGRRGVPSGISDIALGFENGAEWKAKQMAWINVNDKMPEDGIEVDERTILAHTKDVLVLYKNGIVQKGKRIYIDNKKGWQWSCLKGEDITYWMPIVKFDR